MSLAMFVVGGVNAVPRDLAANCGSSTTTDSGAYHTARATAHRITRGSPRTAAQRPAYNGTRTFAAV